MKKKILLISILLLTVYSINGQKQEKRQERRSAKIKALKIAFLTEKLDLTTKQAQEFWPIYNNYNAKLHQLERVEKHNLASKIKQDGGINSISEEDAKLIVNKIKNIDNQVHTIKIAFNTKLTKILSYKKILLLKNAEKDFVRNLMRKYRRKKMNRNN